MYILMFYFMTVMFLSPILGLNIWNEMDNCKKIFVIKFVEIIALPTFSTLYAIYIFFVMQINFEKRNILEVLFSL